jgi:hypothetical protein
MDQITLLKTHCKFQKNTCYVLVGISRKKNNSNITNSKEIVFREILKSEEEIEEKYNKLLSKCENYITEGGDKLNFYIYVSVNGRDVDKTYWNYLKTLIGIGQDSDTKMKYRLDKVWLSELMNPTNKKGRGMFLIDVDTKDKEVLDKVSKMLIDNEVSSSSVFRQETVNGYHYVCEPFNRQNFERFKYDNKLNEVCEVKIDSLLFLTSA